MLWANGRHTEDLGEDMGVGQEEVGANFGSFTPCLQPRSAKSLRRWRESRFGSLWPNGKNWSGKAGRGRERQGEVGGGAEEEEEEGRWCSV